MRILILLIVVTGAAWIIQVRSASVESGARPGFNVPIYGGIYHSALQDNPPTFDPALATDSISVACVLQMFDGLVRFDLSSRQETEASRAQGAITSAVAESWAISSDGLEYRFHLNSKIRFHASTEGGQRTACGGRAVTAADVKFSFERVLDPETDSARTQLFQIIVGADEFMSGEEEGVSGIQAIDPVKAGETGHRSCNLPCTVSIRLKTPYAPFLATLTMSNASVVPREDVEKWGREFRNHPVGTGAFRFETFEPNVRLVLAKNPVYFGGSPYLDRLVFNILPEEDIMFREFLAGRIFHTTVPDPLYNQVRRKDSVWAPYFTEVSQLGTYYFGMNALIPPFDNRLVRRAFSHAVDKTSIVKFIKIGRVQEARGPLPPGIRGYNASLRSYDFNLKLADELLTKAGYPRSNSGRLRTGFPEIPLYIPEGEDHLRITKAIQANLADLGIRAYTVVNTWRTHLGLVKNGKVGLFRLGWVADYMDADNFLYYQFYSGNIGSSNGVSYSNPEVDDLLLRARRSTNSLLRMKLYQQAEQLIVDDAVWICLFYFNTAIVRQPFVHGINLTPMGDQLIMYRDVWLDPEKDRKPPVSRTAPVWNTEGELQAPEAFGSL